MESGVKSADALHVACAILAGSDSFDYTLWRREYFDKMDLDQVSEEAAVYAKSHPHNGKGIRV